MDTNESIRSNTSEQVIVLGVASIETQGPFGTGEPLGIGDAVMPGISEE